MIHNSFARVTCPSHDYGFVGSIKKWAVLLVLQCVLAYLILAPFIRGDIYFAFLDIASDTYVTSAHIINFSRSISEEGLSGWSFGIGLGAPVPFAFNDTLGLLSGLMGPDSVLRHRIWIYLIKISAAGFFFFLLSRSFTQCEASSQIGAIAYSFCGYIVTNGIWDSETNLFVFAPLVLLGILRLIRHDDRLTLPLSLGAMLLSGVFFVLAGVSLVAVFIACVAAARDRSVMIEVWITRVAPLAAIGFMLGAVYVLPSAFQLLDSPRVGGTETLGDRFVRLGLGLSDEFLIFAQLGGLFHKDIFGIGSSHNSYMNYLESPGFYVGMLPLVLLPQLWRGGPRERKILLVGVAAIALYFLFPVIRLSAFGFAAPYFRGTTLWVSIGVLFLGTSALAHVLKHGIDGSMLALGVFITGLILCSVVWRVQVSNEHVFKVAVFIIIWGILLLLSWKGAIGPKNLKVVVLGLVMIELVVMATPSLFAMRLQASSKMNPYSDFTLDALKAVRADNPPLFYRVEKNYYSFSHADALAQGYRGVKSYYYHGQAVVRFHENMDLMHEFNPRPTNYTNWLPGPGERYMLLSALGVRYVISRIPLSWPGLEKIASGPGWMTYRNSFALPLGVVHTMQITDMEFMNLSSMTLKESSRIKDAVVMSAAILREVAPRWGSPLDINQLLLMSEADTAGYYAKAALNAQHTGLRVSHFSEDRIVGTVHPEKPGILVFSIPAYAGWSVRINGEPRALITANFGMLAVPVDAGPHQVELTYHLPGLYTGLWVFLAGVLALARFGWHRRSRRAYS